MFYAYILENLKKPGELYRGHTHDLKSRLGEHNAGKCPHTAKFKPWKVKFYAAFESIEVARSFEIISKAVQAMHSLKIIWDYDPIERHYENQATGKHHTRGDP